MRNELKKCGFAGAILPHDAHPLLALELVTEIFYQLFIPERFTDIVQLHNFAPQPVFLDGKAHFVVAFFQRVVGFPAVEICVHTRFGFGSAGLRRFAHPVKFPLEQFVLAVVSGGFIFLPERFFFKIIRVRSGVTAEFPSFEFNDAIAYVFKEVAIVRNHEKRDARLLKEFFEPFNHFDIQVVGRLVQNKKIRLLQQDFYQSQTLLLSSR